MYKFISFNRKILSCEKAFLQAVSSSTLYGTGVFTTVAVYQKRLFQWQRHWQRLVENAEKIGVDLSKFENDKVEELLFSVVKKNKIENARIRLTFFDQSSNEIWDCAPDEQTAILITAAEFRLQNDNLRLTISPFAINSRSPLANVKSCNYIENILVLKEVKSRNFDEAIRFNEKGEIVSAAMANVFWVKNKEIFTPSLETGCLKGTTKSFILENFSVRESKADLIEINDADEIFLTSAGVGIAKAKSFEGKTLGRKITNQIESEFSNFVY